jgi:DNA-binding transcriptional regulator PaaX
MDENIQPEAIDVIELCKTLQEKGASEEDILAELVDLVKEGKLAEEDLAKAKEYLAKAASDEKAEAERVFGMKFVD